MSAGPYRPGENEPGSVSTGQKLAFALSFAEGCGRLTLQEVEVGPVRVDRLELNIRGLTFPFDLTHGAQRLRDRWLEANLLELSGDPAALVACLTPALSESSSLTDLRLEFHGPMIDVMGRVGGEADGPWFVLQYVHDATPEQSLVLRPALFVLLGPPVVSFPQVAAAVSQLPWPVLRPDGLSFSVTDVPRRVLRSLLPPAGFRVPDCRQLRVRDLEVGAKRFTLAFSRNVTGAAVGSPLALAVHEVHDLVHDGDLAVVQGDLEEARQRYWSAFRREPGHPAIVERLAWLDAVTPARREAARVACERALEHHEFPGLLAILASIALAEGQQEEAARYLQKVAQRFGSMAQSRILSVLGRLLSSRDPGQAAQLLEAAVGWDPSLIEALESLRDCYVALGQRAQLRAVAARLAAAQKTPRKRAQVFVELGHLWLKPFGDLERAKDCFQEALMHQPEDRQALAGLADCHRRGGETAAGLRCYDAVARLASAAGDRDGEAEAHLGAGQLWLEMGDVLSAATRFHRAAKLRPHDARALELAAEADLRLGRYEMAAAGFQDLALVAQEGPDLDLWRRALRRLVRVHLDHFQAPNAALAAVEQLLQKHPNDAEVKRLRDELTRPSEAPRLRKAEEKVTRPPPDVAQRRPPEVLRAPEAREREPRSPAPPLTPANLEAWLAAHLAAPDDQEMAQRVVDGLESLEDWPRLVAVLSGIAENATETEKKAQTLRHLADVLVDGMEDLESGAECLLQLASLVCGPEAVPYARRAAALLRDAGLGASADEAEQLALRLACSTEGRES